MEKPKLITHHTTRLIALLESQPCVYGAEWQLDQSLITWIIMEAQEDLEGAGYYDKMNMEEQVWALFSHVYPHFYPYGHGFPKYNMSPPPSDSLPAQQTQELSGGLRQLSATAKPFIPRTIESARPDGRNLNVRRKPNGRVEYSPEAIKTQADFWVGQLMANLFNPNGRNLRKSIIPLRPTVLHPEETKRLFHEAAVQHAEKS